MNSVTVRLADPLELPRIAHLKEQIHHLHANGRPDLFNPEVDAAVFQEHALNKGMQLLLAESGGSIAGYALVTLVDRPANPHMKQQRFLHVEEFCVDSSFQRMGIGRALMESVRTLAKQNGCQRIALDVWGFNEGAKQFYEAVGFHCYRYFMEMNTDA